MARRLAHRVQDTDPNRGGANSQTTSVQTDSAIGTGNEESKESLGHAMKNKSCPFIHVHLVNLLDVSVSVVNFD